VTGLAVGSPVELRGVRVGKVKSITFSWNEYMDTHPSYIVVEFEMRDDVTPLPPGKARSEMLQAAIKNGLRARLKAQGITGTSILSLEFLNPADNPPLQVPWTPRHTYIPAAPGEFSELLASIEKSLHNVEQLDFNSINQLLQADLKSAGHVLDKVDQVDFGALSTNANSVLTDVHETVGGLKPGLANFDFDALNQTVGSAQQTLRDLDEVLSQLKQYPSGFIFGRPPPPVKGVQSPARN